MEIDELFAALEPNPVLPATSWSDCVNALQLQTLDLQFVNLLAPIIGNDFFAGLDSERGDWFGISKQQIATFTAQKIAEADLPLLRNQNINFADFIKQLDRPVRVIAKHWNQSESSINLLDIQSQIMLAESGQLIPVQSIIQLRVLGTNTWQSNP